MKTSRLFSAALLIAISSISKAEPGTATAMASASIISPASVEVVDGNIKKNTISRKSATHASASKTDTIKAEEIKNGKYNSSLFSVTAEAQISFSISAPSEITLKSTRSAITISNVNVYAGQTPTLSKLNPTQSVSFSDNRFYFCFDGTTSAKTNTNENYSGTYDMSVDYQ